MDWLHWVNWRGLGSIAFVIFGLIVMGLAAIKMHDEKDDENNG